MLNKGFRLHLLTAVVFIQLLILGGQYGSSVYPLYTGKEIRLSLQPIDPRSMFRGQYVILNYELSNFRQPQVEDPIEHIRPGTLVYVPLRSVDEPELEGKVRLQKPDDGLILRGRVKKGRWSNSRLSVSYGIEAYFASPERAKEIERIRSQKSVSASIKVADSGKAALVDLHYD